MFLLAILLLVIVSMGLVVVSPLGLSALDNGSQVDWNRLSNIGQTYGAVSTIIAAVALLGVMISLAIQRREAKTARKHAQRSHVAELMRMAMDDPRYMECWGPYLTENFDTQAQFAYINLVVAHWYAQYEIGDMTDVLLQATATGVFASKPGRQYWQLTGPFWRDNYSGRRARRFHQVLNKTYQEAIKKPPPRPPTPVVHKSEPVRSDRTAGRRWIGLVVAAGGGAAVAVVVMRAIRRVLRRVRSGRY